MNLNIIRTIYLALCAGLIATHVQAAVLSHGPILGDIGPTHAEVWGRTDTSALVSVAYGPIGLPVSDVTVSLTTAAGSDFTFTTLLPGLLPRAQYHYHILVDGVPSTSNTFRTAPIEGDPGSVSIAVFCDGWRDKPFPAAAPATRMQPDLALTCGDMDHKNTTSLKQSRTMHKAMRGPETLFGADFSASRLGREIPLYSVWSDHDYCKDNSTERCASRETALQAWGEYHAFPVDHGFPQGIWHRVVYGQVEIYMLDTRSNRNPTYCHAPACRNILGPGQEAWLFARLLASTARWKVLVFDVPFHREYLKGGDSWQGYPDSRGRLVEYLTANQIMNVVFVSGDIHSGGAIDDGTYSERPELSVPLANAGFANTGGNHPWGVGRSRQATPGFGWLMATQDSLTLAAYGADGALRLSYTVTAQ